ncbi:MAG TPA: FAD-dependent monooxygenase [Burkholderiales bacterium]|nr:FAD-dependent monooxygenase [Burkholderiales bacterium]
MQKQRAIVVGGSIGGLFAANLLAKLGWAVDVYERVADDLAGRGAGIGTHEELFAVMRELGIAVDDSIGVRVDERVCLDERGAVVHRLLRPQVMSHWVRIYRPLRERLAPESYHAGRTFIDFTDDDGEIVAHFDDGASARADLLVGADGLRSTVRTCLFPDVQPAYAGYVGWRGIVAESALPTALREQLGNNYYCALPPGEMLVLYPVPGRYWNYVWYRPVPGDPELADLAVDASGPHVRPELAARLKSNARSTLAPPLAEVVEHTQPFFQAIYDVETPHIAAGRVVLLGDAAYVARPHVGMGVTKAALDAASLVRSLASSQDVDAALARYARLRGEFGRRCVRRGRRLGAYIEARARPHLSWPPAALDQDPKRLLREIGASLAQIPELEIEL